MSSNIPVEKLIENRIKATCFETRADVEKILDILHNELDKYGFLTVRDFYDICEKSPEEYGIITLEKNDIFDNYGWTRDMINRDFWNNRLVSYGAHGYYIKMPEVIFLGYKSKDLVEIGDALSKGLEEGLKNPKYKPLFTIGVDRDGDIINHPQHYISETGLEVIDVIEAFTFDLKGIEAVDIANILKYVCRYKKKNGIEDLKKAQWYLNNLIIYLETLENENKGDSKNE